MRRLIHEIVSWPAKGEFRISRSALTEFVVVQLFISQNGFTGRAECRPYARYGETAQSVIAQIERVKGDIEQGLSRRDIQTRMPPGAARNAIDCALWDLEAKTMDKPVWTLGGFPKPRSRETAFTLSIDSPKNMARAARSAKDHKFLKMKIGREGGLDAVRAVLAARSDASLIVDANEALKPEDLRNIQDLKHVERISLIEQPFSSGLDFPRMFDSLSPVICADESLHTSDDLPRLWKAGYRAVNVKLDKTGGLTEALKLMRTAKSMGFQIMAGCMVGSSLAMAPMVMLESFADYIDLDGPLLLNDDFDPPLKYKGGKVFPPSKDLWG